MTQFRHLLLYRLYAGLGLGAILLSLLVLTGQAQAQTSAESPLHPIERLGDMKKMGFHKQPRPPVTTVFLDEHGAEVSLADFRGKIVLMNFWATWCAPCRHEMPSLDALQAELGGDDFEVLAIATGRNPLPAVRKFFKTANVTNIAIHRDPKQILAKQMGVLGLPVSLIINQEGREIARLTGDANWNSKEAQALFRTLLSARSETR